MRERLGALLHAYGKHEGWERLHLLAIRSVDDNDARAYERERDQGKPGVHGVGLSQEHRRHRRAKDRRHEPKDAHAAHRICGEKP